MVINSSHHAETDITADYEKQQKTAKPKQLPSKIKRRYLTYKEKGNIFNINKRIQKDGVGNLLILTSKLCKVPKSTILRRRRRRDYQKNR